MKNHFFPAWLSCLFFFTFFSLPALATASDPVTVVDSTGHTLTIEQHPNRIACLYAFCGHVIAMLDRGKDMVAIVNGLKKDRLLHKLIPHIKQVPVPARGGIISIEALLKTKPDIVFLKPETAAIQAEIKKLTRFNLPYFVAGYHCMEEQMGIIEMMGTVIGRKQKAFAYTRYYKSIIDRVKKKTSHIPENKRVRLYHSVNEPRRTDAPGTIEADWTNAAGVNNVSVGRSLQGKGNKNFADIEQILLWNPDVIIVNEDGVDQKILTDKKWSSIKAVQNTKVFAIPVGISRWGHPGGLETPLAILWTAKTVYPELFKEMDLKKEMVWFYKTFFNLNLDDDMINNILDNKGMRHHS
ncbi:MAG: ABC transporter substrate-binding protein [Desulfobacteraceae bacterium]|nr:ABC transporter substrate-binding protein [Desulfobacteraceae bacterium]